MAVEWARLARVGERGKEWSQQARHAVSHSDPQICHSDQTTALGSLLQKTQTRKMPDLAVVARTPFWSFCAGQRRIGPGQITDGT